MDDISGYLKKVGFPSFDEFCANAEKYMGRDDDRLAEVDRGHTGKVRQVVSRQTYEIEGYKCKTLEEVERIAKERGIPLRELDYRPQLIPMGAGKADVLVRFISKAKRETRGEW
jgi:hypothetical protein